MLELLTDPQAWIALLTLTALELVLALGATSGADTVAGLAVGLGDQ